MIHKPKYTSYKHLKISAQVSPVRLVKSIFQFNWKRFTEPNKQVLGVWIREELVQLGPAFIKLGQFLATRIDVFGKDITTELEKLQDSIEPIPFEDIRRFVGEIHMNDFKTFSKAPIATASIGQVHRATLKNGRSVVVKIQKPGIAKQIRGDIAILKGILEAVSFLRAYRQFIEIESLINQYEGFLSVELDYDLEMQNMQIFNSFFSGFPWVKIPEPIRTYNNGTVLVMEYVPSIKITDVAALKKKGIDTKRTAQVLVQTFIQMMVVNGTVHCDPHPGNLGIIAESDTLVLYDFGNVVKLDKGFFKMMRRILFALYQKNIDEFTKLLITSRIITLPDDTDILELKAFFRYFVKYLENPDLQALKISINEGGVIGASNINFRIDPNFLSIFRVFSLLDGTCTTLDPKFSYFEALAPFADDIFNDQTFMGQQAMSDFQKLQSFPAIIQNTEDTVSRVNQRVNTVTKTIDQFKYITLAIIILDNIASPERLVALIPLVLWTFMNFY